MTAPRRPFHLQSRLLIPALVALAASMAPAWAGPFTWKTGRVGLSSAGTNWVGEAVPPNDYTADGVIDGETSSGAVMTLVSGRFNTLKITAGDVMQATSSTTLDMINSGGLNPSYTGSLVNAGTMRATGAGVLWQLQVMTTAALTNSGVIEGVSGAQVYIPANNATFINAGGVFRALTGGTIQVRGNPVNLTGGNMFVDSLSAVVTTDDVQPKLTLTSVTTTNAGTFDFTQPQNVAAGRQKGVTQTGGAFNNEGRIVLNSAAPATITGTASDSRGDYYIVTAGSGGVFYNSGTIIVSNTALSASSNHAAYFTVNTGNIFSNTTASVISLVQNSVSGAQHTAYANITPAFTNNGLIDVRFLPATVTTKSYARFSCSNGVMNAGTVTVVGAAASFDATNKTYTQTSGSTIVSDGGIVQATVNVNGGSVRGDNGTINGALTINAGGTLAPGTNALAAIGTLSVSTNTTLSGTYIVDIDGATGDVLRVTGGSLALNPSSQWVMNVINQPTLTEYTIIDKASPGAVGGAFSNSSITVAGRVYSIHYDGGTGNDVVLRIGLAGSVITIR